MIPNFIEDVNQALVLSHTSTYKRKTQTRKNDVSKLSVFTASLVYEVAGAPFIFTRLLNLKHLSLVVYIVHHSRYTLCR